MIKPILLGITLIGLAVSAQAAVITDNFNRANTAYSTDVSTAIGGDWFNGGVSGNSANFRINSNQLEYGGGSANVPLINAGLETKSGGGFDFTLSGSIQSNNGAVAQGLVFNYQDSSNYYALRFYPTLKSLQAVKVVGGSLNLMTPSSFVTNSEFDEWSNPSNYDLRITSNAAFSFDVYVKDVSSGKTIEFSATDADSNFTGGYAGLYSTSGGNAAFDDFRLETVPEPTALALLGLSLLPLLARRRKAASA